MIEQPRKSVPIFTIPIVLTGAALLAFAATGIGGHGIPLGSLIPNTGQMPVSGSAWLFLTDESPAAPVERETVQPLVESKRQVCPLPVGWIKYTVTPTDTLFRLSVVYGISVAELQTVNCMGEETLLMPGDEIYVPVLPTRTPSLTPTIFYRPPVIAAGGEDDDGPSRPAATATAVPEEPTISPTDPPANNPPPKEDNKGKDEGKKDKNKGKGKGKD